MPSPKELRVLDGPLAGRDILAINDSFTTPYFVSDGQKIELRYVAAHYVHEARDYWVWELDHESRVEFLATVLEQPAIDPIYARQLAIATLKRWANG